MNDQQDMKDQVEKLNHVNQLILDSVAEGIYGINLEAKVIFWNKSAEWLTGYTRGTRPGSSVSGVSRFERRREHVREGRYLLA